jgi:hypothetical protein
MAFPTGTFTGDSGDLDVFIPAVWGQKINDFYRSNLVCANFFVDRSEEVRDGGNIVYTPNITEISATSKTVATAVALNSPTETAVTLTISNWYEASFAIEDREAAQVKHSYAIMNTYAENAAYAIAKVLDTAITSLFSGFSQSVGASTTAVADSEIRQAIAYLDSANVPQNNRAFFFDPTVFWTQLQNIDKFSLAINSPVQDPVAKVPMAMLYGIPVYITSQVQYVSGTTGRYNALAHKDAIHWATSPLGSGGSKGSMVGSDGIRVQANYEPTYLSTVVTADILYGVIENRDTSGVKILTKATA